MNWSDKTIYGLIDIGVMYMNHHRWQTSFIKISDNQWNFFLIKLTLTKLDKMQRGFLKRWICMASHDKNVQEWLCEFNWILELPHWLDYWPRKKDCLLVFQLPMLLELLAKKIYRLIDIRYTAQGKGCLMNWITLYGQGISSLQIANLGWFFLGCVSKTITDGRKWAPSVKKLKT